MTFEGQKFQGQQAIIGKFTTLPFQKVAVSKDTIDVQPSISGGILVFVTGKLMVRKGYGYGFRRSLGAAGHVRTPCPLARQHGVCVCVRACTPSERA